MDNSQGQPSLQHHRRSRLLFLISIVVSLLIIIGGGVYFLISQNNKSSQSEFLGQRLQKEQPNQPSQVPTITRIPLLTKVPTPLDDSKWKTYRTKVYTLQYPKEWEFDYYSIQNGVQIFNPTSVKTVRYSAFSQEKVIGQYVTLSTISSSDSASMFVDKVQFDCCIGPSAPAGNAAKFQKKSIDINGVTALAYTPVGEIRAWDIVLSTGKHIILVQSTITDPQGTTLENQLISSIKLLE